MSQTQYKSLMSNLLNEKRALTKLRAELEGRKGKLCQCCKKFGHLARNCRNKKEEGKGATTPQNKFKILSSRVMQCGVEGKTIRSVRMEEEKCFRKKGHKCRECPLWIKRKNEEKAAHVAMSQKVQRERRPVRPVRGKAQERKLRKVEQEEAACTAKPQEVQHEWKRSSWEALRKRAEWYCGPTVPQDAELWELG